MCLIGTIVIKYTLRLITKTQKTQVSLHMIFTVQPKKSCPLFLEQLHHTTTHRVQSLSAIIKYEESSRTIGNACVQL